MAFRPSQWDCSIGVCCSHQSHHGIWFFKRLIWSFYWWSEMNLLNSRGNWLLISIQVIQTIVTEFTTFNLQKAFTTEFENILAIILITTVIRIRLSEDCWIITSTASLEIVQQYSPHLRLTNMKCTVLCKSNAREMREFRFLFLWTFVEIPCESSRDNLRLFEQKFRGRKGAISLSFRFETKVQWNFVIKSVSLLLGQTRIWRLRRKDQLCLLRRWCWI